MPKGLGSKKVKKYPKVGQQVSRGNERKRVEKLPATWPATFRAKPYGAFGFAT